MAMVSIIARPTKSVREIVPADSGWRAIASMAAAMARPSARAGPRAPKETAIVAAMMLMNCGVMRKVPLGLDRFGADRGADIDGREDGKDIGLDESDHDAEDHEGYGDEQAREDQDDADDEFVAHDVAEQAHHQRESARDLRKHVERKEDRVRASDSDRDSRACRAPGDHRNERREDDDGERAGVSMCPSAA